MVENTNKKYLFISYLVAVFCVIGLCAYWVVQINIGVFQGVEGFILAPLILLYFVGSFAALVLLLFDVFKKKEGRIVLILAFLAAFFVISFAFAMVLLWSLPTSEGINLLYILLMLPSLAVAVWGFAWAWKRGKTK